MDSKSLGASHRLIDLAQRLRLFKPDSPSGNNDDSSIEDRAVRQNGFKLIPQELGANGVEFAANPIAKLPERVERKRAAVLICLFEDEEGDLRVILTKRSSTLSTHSGDVSLPGGKTDEGDANDIETALREAKEEIGLDPSLVNLPTVLEPIYTRSGMVVVPVIGILPDKRAFKPVPNTAEVEAIFDAPLAMFLKNENRRAEEREWMGHKYLLHFFDYEAENGKYVIWALTAGILIKTATLVYQQQPEFQERRPKFWSRSCS